MKKPGQIKKVGSRRTFLKNSLFGGISLIGIDPTVFFFDKGLNIKSELSYDIDLFSPTRLFDGDKCWAHPRAGIIPGKKKTDPPRVVMTLNTLDLSGSDVFKGMLSMKSDDFGRTWDEPAQSQALAPAIEEINQVRHPVAVSDFWPKWHKQTRTLLGIGHTIVYTPDWKVTYPRPRHTAYSVYDPKKNAWSAWKKLEMNGMQKFHHAGAGCVQRYDEANGEIKLPIYFTPDKGNSRITVCRCAFNGKDLKFLEQGNELAIDDGSRGLHEPSLTYFNGVYYLTLRNDHAGYVTKSKDGLVFEPIRAWKFDDGSDLGNYNTQQHWVTHSDGLFLVYTRRGAGNDHVFRHRAPLFMAQVDPDRMVVIRESEQILVPERGARLGNFGVTDVSPDETWVTVSEWMQPKGVEKYGSDGSVFVARIQWNRPNGLFEK